MLQLTSELFTDDEKSTYEKLYNRYKRIMLNYAYSILKDRSLAEDAVHEAFIKLGNNLQKVHNLECNKTLNYLVTIVKNTSLTILKKQNKNKTMDFDSLEYEIIDDKIDIQDDIVSSEKYNLIMEIIDELKDELKTPFLLKMGQGYSNKEIAEILNISDNNVAVRIYRAKKKIVKLLECKRVKVNE